MTARYDLILVLLALTILAMGCTEIIAGQCHTSKDCPPSDFCKLGQCTDLDGESPFEESELTVEGGNIADVDAGRLEDGGLPAHPCPDATMADHQNLVLNELLAAVPTGPEGDANGDGVRHFHDDEFVELVNISDETLDLTDVTILNDTRHRFTFPETCLDPLHAVVVFGGIEPGAELPEGEGYRSYVADSRFAYADGGGRAVVRDANGSIIADYTYGSHSPQSLNLSADLHGDTYQPHSQLAEDNALFSPGKCTNGQPFPTGCTDDSDDEADENHDSQESLNDYK